MDASEASFATMAIANGPGRLGKYTAAGQQVRFLLNSRNVYILPIAQEPARFYLLS